MHQHKQTTHPEPITLHLRVEEARVGFQVRLASPLGEAETGLRLPCPEARLEAFIGICRSVVRPGGQTSGHQKPWFVQAMGGAVAEEPAALARQIGIGLFGAVLNGPTAELYRTALSTQQQERFYSELRVL